MIGMRLAEIAAVVGGTLHRATGDERVTAVEFDTRRLTSGGLFAALPGARSDGHDHAAAALAAGAAGVLAGREVDAPAVLAPPAPRHGDTELGATDPDGTGAAVLAALARLAGHVTATLPELTVIGVTGSSGKTSTKDLLAAVLAPLGEVIAPPGSFNNELGLPWTALRAGPDTRHLVLEFSARGIGHIARLAAAVPPRIGVVLNVGSAHLAGFGSRDGIARAKGELVAALPSAADGGLAVLNADDPAVAAMAGRTRAAVRWTSAAGDRAADVAATDLVLDAGRARFTLRTPDGSAPVALRLVGAHHVANALSAAAVGLARGLTPDAVAAALSAAAPVSRWRMETTERADGVTVVNDAYNANVESMRAALAAVAAMAGRRRVWAVLGGMAELGQAAAAAHAEVADAARAAGVARLVEVGSGGGNDGGGDGSGDGGGGAAGAYPGAQRVADIPAAVALLRAELAPGDVVLVKASRAVGLDRVATALLEGRPGPAPALDGRTSAADPPGSPSPSGSSGSSGTGTGVR